MKEAMIHAVTRTQHPVGQGCFFSEEHWIDDDTAFHIVYDCGSTSDAKTALRTRIEQFAKDSAAREGVIVISHFHEDHINGLDRLKNSGVKFRHLFIPGLTPVQAQVVFLDIAARPEVNTKTFGALRTAWDLLIQRGETWGQNIVRIFPEGANNDQEPLNLPSGGATHPHSRDIYPGSSLARLNWKLRFYCHIEAAKIAELATTLGEDLRAAFAGGFDKFIEWRSDKKRSGSVIRKYRRAMGLREGDQKWDNLVSLCCYSGPSNPGEYYACVKSCDIFGCLRRAGWLGTGDIPLGNLRNGGVAAWAGFSKHYEKELPSVSIVTVPHHGSPDDHKADFYHHGMTATISYGSKKALKYGHPDPAVLHDILNRGAVPVHVTEDPNSAFVRLSFRILRLNTSMNQPHTPSQTTP